MTTEAPPKPDAAATAPDAATKPDTAKPDAATKPDSSGKPDAAAKPDAAPRKTILGGDPAKSGEPTKPAEKPEGAPEKYANFTLPEGIEIRPELLESFGKEAKALNLSQVAAQKLVDLQAQNVKAEIEGRLVAFNAQIETWDKETRTHFGANADKEFGNAAYAMEQIGTPELKTLLNESGFGSHPEIVKYFAKVGGMLREDQPIDGKRAGGEAASTADLMYPTMNKKK